MGMDLVGHYPTASEGRAFSVNWTGWRPLVDCVLALAPNEAAPCRDWESNDCPGLEAPETLKLVAKLQALRDRGAIANYAALYNGWRDQLPQVTCVVCSGAGGLPARPADPGDPVFGPIPACSARVCDCCKGSGMMEHPDAIDRVHLELVDCFIAFLRASGGFASFETYQYDPRAIRR
jgi:hypothetical protein